MPEPLDAIVLSPHLDDAALSCGGQLARRSGRGERLLVVTIFAGDEPESPHSLLATKLHRLFGLEAEVVARRRREDAAACEALGAESVHWDFEEAIYRRDEAGEALYRRLGQLFEEPPAEESALVPRITERLAALPPARQILVPLGVGGHVDHRLVRRAAEELDGGTEAQPLTYYEELPYAATRRAVRRALGRRRHWRQRRIELTPQELERKIEACSLYTSQVDVLFGSPRRMARRLRRYARQVGGERLWERQPA